MASDFAAILREPVPVTVGGRRILLPYRPAAVWARSLDRLHFLAPQLADEDGREAMAELIIESPGAVAEIRSESLRILTEAVGRKWWEASRLIATSASSSVLGSLVLAGVDPWNRSVGEWCAAVYTLCTRHADEKALLKFDFTLSLPPPGYEDEWDDEGDDPAAIQAGLAKMIGKR